MRIAAGETHPSIAALWQVSAATIGLQAHRLGLAGSEQAPEDTWPAERVALLKQLIGEGVTYSEIGRRMGLTKNQCLAKANRLGAPVRREAAQQRSATAERLAKLDVFPPPGRCVFPKGHPGTEGFHFCGEGSARVGVPYCAEHMAVSYEPASRLTDVMKQFNFAASKLASQVRRG